MKGKNTHRAKQANNTATATLLTPIILLMSEPASLTTTLGAAVEDPSLFPAAPPVEPPAPEPSATPLVVTTVMRDTVTDEEAPATPAVAAGLLGSGVVLPLLPTTGVVLPVAPLPLPLPLPLFPSGAGADVPPVLPLPLPLPLALAPLWLAAGGSPLLLTPPGLLSVAGDWVDAAGGGVSGEDAAGVPGELG
jgi:hypothetical protein